MRSGTYPVHPRCLLCALLLLAACAGKPARQPSLQAGLRPAQRPEVGKQQLLERLSDFASKAGSFTADSSMVYSRWDGRSNRIDLKLAVLRPDRLYMKGYRSPLPAFFTLTGNDKGVWLDVPSRSKTYYVPPGVRLEPDQDSSAEAFIMDSRQFVSVLVPEPPSTAERYVLTSSTRGLELLALDRLDDRLVRRLVFEPVQLLLTEMSLYDADGVEVSHVLYGSYRESENLEFPHLVTLERPLQGAVLEFRFKKVTPRSLTSDRFAFRPNPRHELEELESGESPGEAVPWPEEQGVGPGSP